MNTIQTQSDSYTITSRLDEEDMTPVFEIKSGGAFITNCVTLEDAFELIRKGITPAKTLEEMATDWIYSHGQAVLDDMDDDIADEFGISHDAADKVIELIEAATVTVKFD